MAFDGLFTRAITHEIANSLYTGRISKIYQPSKYEILLHIRANGKKSKTDSFRSSDICTFTLNKSKL
ncbi:NFACT family protein [Bacillus pacificus]